jgi:hypothetical protein
MESLSRREEEPPATDPGRFLSFEEAYHRLLIELTERQVDTIYLAMGKTPIEKIYIDGGFADNDIFLQILALRLPHYEFVPSHNARGSALGAALAISKR